MSEYSVTQGQFVEKFFEEMEDNGNFDMEDETANTVENEGDQNQKEDDATTASAKKKRRSNLAEFGPEQVAKRKNESAKRELTSIVKQLGKIDRQLDSRVSINFVATFTSFNSNRTNTFLYPSNAKLSQTLLDRDTTITAIKDAVRDAMNDFPKDNQVRNGISTDPTQTQTEVVLATPTKTIDTFTVLPSPVAVKGQPLSAVNLCLKNSCSFGKKIKHPVWIKCAHRSDEHRRCSYWVHAPCIGFPFLKAEDVSMVDGWHCPEHTGFQVKQK